jgi:hypothetical protein
MIEVAVITPISAIRSLYENYNWRGILVFLRSRDIVLLSDPIRRGSGWWLVLRYPGAVVQTQDALASGAHI